MSESSNVITPAPPEPIYQKFELPEFSTGDGDLDSPDDRPQAVRLRVELGRTRISAERAEQLAADQVVALDRRADAAIGIFAGDRLVARGEMVVVDQRLCLRVLETFAALLLTLIFLPLPVMGEPSSVSPAAPLPFAAPLANDEAKLPFSLVKTASPPTGGQAAERVVSRAAAEQPIPLAPPGRDPATGDRRAGGGSASNTALTVVGSLLVVLGLFGVFVWLVRRSQGRRSTSLPEDVVETLGQTPLNGKQQLQLVRVGNKLLLLAVTASSAETLTEITDADEIDRLTTLCQHSRQHGLTTTFRDVLSHLNATAEDPRYESAAR